MKEQKFDSWCIVELFGHQKMAGKVSESTLAGGNMLRVDVPETKSQGAFTRILNPSAIYAINPVTEEVAMVYAENLEVKPISVYDIREHVEKLHKQLTAGEAEEVES